MKYLITTILTLICGISACAQLTFTGLTDKAIAVKPESNTGIETVYIVDNAYGATATYTASSPTATVEWARYSQLGGGYSEPVNFTRDGAECSISLGNDDMGYIVTENGRQHCYWIVNYMNHTMTLNGAAVNTAESDCAMTALEIDGVAPRITYYTITGVPRDMSREIEITYRSLSWDDESQVFNQTTENEKVAYISGSTVRVPAPLCDTDFEISGDRFLKEWGREISAVTDSYATVAIDAHTSAQMAVRDNDNEIRVDNGDLGGSAPVDITFTAVASDAVAYREWQMSSSPDFDIIDLRFNQDEVDYTFTDFGITYVRYVAANASGDCEWISDTYQVSVGDSKIECPNAFSPGASEGINDEWKVSYKSIIQFECHIFNQWGVKLFSTTDPSQGWDGKHGGKVVPAGVYYYVIKARGADGRNYSLSGDINIINYRQGANRTGTAE
ncbi:MAG: gliding motility-associated C-terminal domain-containing protein [Muribaculaceae bacterium]|nr:gliding motility-associated C-terminal domain-containing protein [Muribaculaceae bacterium]